MMKYHIEPKRMRLVHPYADREPNMVLIEGLKGGKKPYHHRKTVSCIQGA